MSRKFLVDDLRVLLGAMESRGNEFGREIILAAIQELTHEPKHPNTADQPSAPVAAAPSREDLVTIHEAVTIIGMCRTAILRLIDQGRIRGWKESVGKKRVMLLRKDVESWSNVPTYVPMVPRPPKKRNRR